MVLSHTQACLWQFPLAKSWGSRHGLMHSSQAIRRVSNCQKLHNNTDRDGPPKKTRVKERLHQPPALTPTGGREALP